MNGRLRDNSEGTKESAYMTTQLISGGSITAAAGDPGVDSSGANVSPRGTKNNNINNLEKMNVMNFINKNKNANPHGRDRSGAGEGRFD